MTGAGREMALQARLSAVIARERSVRPKQSPIRQGDGFAEFPLREANMQAMASASYVMALQARLSAVIARERSLRPKQSPL